MSKKTTPIPQSERVRASEARKIQAGGMRLPGGILSQDAAEALNKLLSEAYGDSKNACIGRALVEAAERLKPVRR